MIAVHRKDKTSSDDSSNSRSRAQSPIPFDLAHPFNQSFFPATEVGRYRTAHLLYLLLRFTFRRCRSTI
jgi:hypothetical protein